MYVEKNHFRSQLLLIFVCVWTCPLARMNNWHHAAITSIVIIDM